MRTIITKCLTEIGIFDVFNPPYWAGWDIKFPATPFKKYFAHSGGTHDTNVD